MRFSRALTLLLLAALIAAPSFGRGKPIFTLTDPRGDDHGDGNLIYPGNEDLGPGDLDILSLSAEDQGNGTMFEVTFAKPVRVPARRAIDDIGTQLDAVARYGFYTLNLDLYIDKDRVPGSGGVTMLPGRHAEIDPASAWEKAVILTPRPNEAQEELKRMLLKTLNEDAKRDDSDLKNEEVEALKKQIPLDIESRIFFPTQVKVRGQKISFFVPATFLGGPAQATWSYVAATSGADLLVSFDVNRVLGRAPGQKSLMILPISPGRWQDRFGGGRENAAIQPPLVDILVPQGKKQEAILSDFDSRAKDKRPVVIPGVVPAEQK
ncbi:MAG TPA: glucodextranase DOMON-like domain-containing protein [Thermoanaerobaculia bacterium]|nr:glucodextranase DOMON-like domain-containing protein [Thermoanaerobaculia bacterium]